MNLVFSPLFFPFHHPFCFHLFDNRAAYFSSWKRFVCMHLIEVHFWKQHDSSHKLNIIILNRERSRENVYRGQNLLARCVWGYIVSNVCTTYSDTVLCFSSWALTFKWGTWCFKVKLNPTKWDSRPPLNMLCGWPKTMQFTVWSVLSFYVNTLYFARCIN